MERRRRVQRGQRRPDHLLAVADRRIRAHAEVDVALGHVRVPALDQRLDQLDDRSDRLAGQRLVVGPTQAQPVRIRQVGRRHLRRQL